MHTHRSIVRLRAYWPPDPPIPDPSRFDEIRYGLINRFPVYVSIWTPGSRPRETVGGVWHPFGGGCLVSLRIGESLSVDSSRLVSPLSIFSDG